MFKPKPLSQQVKSFIYRGGKKGRTIQEIRQHFVTHHHGSLSGQVSLLHRSGRIERLVDKREGCHIYVDPRFVAGRQTAAQGRNKAVLEFAVANERGTLVFRGPEDSARKIFANSGTGLVLIKRKVTDWEVVS